MPQRKQYQVINLNRDQFEQILNITNPTKQDFICVKMGEDKEVFVIGLLAREAIAFRKHMPTNSRLEKLAKQDMLQ